MYTQLLPTHLSQKRGTLIKSEFLIVTYPNIKLGLSRDSLCNCKVHAEQIQNSEIIQS